MEQLSQLSELLWAILQIFTSGAAQKSLKLDIAKNDLKNKFWNFFFNILWSEHMLRCCYNCRNLSSGNFKFSPLAQRKKLLKLEIAKRNLKYEEHCRGTYAKISKNSRVPKDKPQNP